MITALLAIVVLMAFSVEGVVGFGSTVLTVSLGVHLMPLQALLPALVPLNLVMSTAIVARDLHLVDVRLLVFRILPFAAVGMVFGLALFRLFDPKALEVVLAGFVMVLAVVEIWRLNRERLDASPTPLGRVASAALLCAGGIAHGLFGSGGPMVVYVTSREVDGKGRFRATLAGLWIVLNATLFINYAALGLLGYASFATTLALAPALALAMPLGQWLHRRTDERAFRPMVYAVLLLAGMALGARSLVSR